MVVRPIAAVAALALFVGCSRAPQPRQPLSLKVFINGDTRGRLEPCGCFDGQFGGLTRVSTKLQQDRQPGDLVLDIGDALAGYADYDLIQYEYLLQAFAMMRFDAVNAGHREAGLPAAELRRLSAAAPIPLVSANLLSAEDGQPVWQPFVVVVRGGYRIGVTGVLDDQTIDADQLGDGLVLSPMALALSGVLPRFADQVDMIVLMAFTDESGMRTLAREFFELDLIVGGKVTQPAQDPITEGSSVIIYTTNQSRALGSLQLRLTDDGTIEAGAYAMSLLHTLIVEDPRIRDLSTAYRKQIRGTELAIDRDSFLAEDRVPGVTAAATFVGTDACAVCHQAAFEIWRESRHAHAFETLISRQSDADPRCIGCHTIGFGLPGGYRRGGDRRLVNVGCESCHGPGSAHVEQHSGDEPAMVRYRPLGAGDCQRCHHGEFSRPFDWDAFWPAVAHGKE